MKKAGITHKKNETSVLFSPKEKFLRKQLQEKRRRVWLEEQRRREEKASFEESMRRRFGSKRAVLYLGKLGHIWATPLGVAKYLAEELRSDLPHGAELLAQEVALRWDGEGFVPKMLKALSEYLEDEQPVFKPMDDAIANILEKHPRYTIKEITSELDKQYPNQREALARRVQRFFENVPWLPKEHAEDWLGGY